MNTRERIAHHIGRVRNGRSTIGLAMLLAAGIQAAAPASAATEFPADLYERATAGISAEALDACRSAAMQVIAHEVRVGAAIDWKQEMAPGDMGRRISSSWAERVGGSDSVPDDLRDTYLIAVTGEAMVTPAAGPAFTAVPVCWFDFTPGQGGPVLYRTTMRTLP